MKRQQASEMSGLSVGQISRGRQKLQKPREEEEKKEEEDGNTNYDKMLEEWGDKRVQTTSGKTQKRMPFRTYKDNFDEFIGWVKANKPDDNQPSLSWFTDHVKKRRWLLQVFDRYRCPPCFLGKMADDKLAQGCSEETMIDIPESMHEQHKQKSIKDIIDDRDKHIKVVTSISTYFKNMVLHGEQNAIMLIHDSSTSKFHFPHCTAPYIVYKCTLTRY